MGEVVNVLVAFAVIVFLLRWITSGKDSTEQKSATDILGFRPKNVSQDMVNTISTMFPDIPTDNIRFDLLRTGSVELTTNKILEKGYLDPPPQPYYTLYPRQPVNHPTNPHGNGTSQLNSPRRPKAESLISRYDLEDRVRKGESIPEEEMERVGGKATWEDAPERREANLRERKAKMVLAARQRFLAQQQKEVATTGDGVEQS